jgi:hypothetical protein
VDVVQAEHEQTRLSLTPSYAPTLMPEPAVSGVVPVETWSPRHGTAGIVVRAAAVTARAALQQSGDGGAGDDSTSDFQPSPEQPSSDEANSAPTPPPSPKPYAELGRTQRRKRARAATAEVMAVLDSYSMTPEHLVPNIAPPKRVVNVLSSSYSLRNYAAGVTSGAGQLGAFRNLNGAELHGVYVLDPLRLIHVVCPSWERATILVDSGGGTTKVGLNLHEHRSDRWHSAFLPLLVYAGKDNNAGLAAFAALPASPFIGTSSAHVTLWALLQSLIDGPRPVYLCGDLNSIAAIRGQMQSNATWGCCWCLAKLGDPAGQLAAPRVKDQSDLVRGRLEDRPQLLAIDPARIVPPSLHLFLGLGNALLEAMADVCPGVKDLREAVRGAEPSGVSEVFALNGNQLASFIKTKRATVVNTFVATTHNTRGGAQPAGVSRLRQMSCWLKKLHAFMLPGAIWPDARKQALGRLVDDMTANWDTVTGLSTRPKLHVLAHTVDFAAAAGALGAFNEAAVERYHAELNKRLHDNIAAPDPVTRLQRAVGSTLTQLVAKAQRST